MDIASATLLEDLPSSRANKLAELHAQTQTPRESQYELVYMQLNDCQSKTMAEDMREELGLPGVEIHYDLGCCQGDGASLSTGSIRVGKRFAKAAGLTDDEAAHLRGLVKKHGALSLQFDKEQSFRYTAEWTCGWALGAGRASGGRPWKSLLLTACAGRPAVYAKLHAWRIALCKRIESELRSEFDQVLAEVMVEDVLYDWAEEDAVLAAYSDGSESVLTREDEGFDLAHGMARAAKEREELRAMVAGAPAAARTARL